MRILVANDDGIQSEGLLILARWAKKLGDVTVCAPAEQQSAKSHAINIHDPIQAYKVSYTDGIDAYIVHSTPADCVRFGTLGLHKHYDLILSGVNKGFNMGEDILYSGTVANIYEAALRGCHFNVNIPLHSKGIKWTRQGGAYFTDEFIRTGEGLYSQEGHCVYEIGTDFTLDTDSVMNGFISVTPLSVRRDDLDAWRKVRLP